MPPAKLRDTTPMQIPGEILRSCWFLAGPTACGKTAAGIALAQRLGAEIIALDSMSLYRHMDIGTAKPTAEERALVPHYLIDLVEPRDEYSVAQYVSAAEGICRQILARGRVPLFVGGTGLYLRAVLRGVFEAAPASPEVRRRLAEELDRSSPEELHRRLAAIDPVAAERLHENDTRRVLRALEVYELTGRPASALQQQTPLPENERPRHVYWLHPPREWLYERIDLRVDRMIAAGLVDEVRELSVRPGGLSRTARQALGYREILAFLAGETDLPAAIEQIKTKTRQFAKRQHTWFRNLVECREVAVTGNESAEQLATRLSAAST